MDIDPVKYIRNLAELVECLRNRKPSKKVKKCKHHVFTDFRSTLEVPLPHKVCQKCGGIRLYGERTCL